MLRARIVSGVIAAVVASVPAVAQTTTCPNVESSGLPGATVFAQDPSLAADGRKVAFASNAQVVPGFSPYFQVCVRDLATGVAVRASVDSAGTVGNGHSAKPQISADGRWVAFNSGATNLVAGDTNGVNDVFLHDLATGTTARASLDAAGVQTTRISYVTAISADGRFVVFETTESLAPTDTNTEFDVYVRDVLANTTIHASRGTGGVSSAGACMHGSISADGRRVVFSGAADDLVAGDTNGFDDVFVRNLGSGTTVLVSVASSGASGDNRSRQCAISGDGQSVAFTSEATNFTVPPTSGVHAFVRDLVSSTTMLVDVNTAGAAPNAVVYDIGVDIGHDGRFVAFASGASDLVAGDTNLVPDIFVRDRLIGTTTRANVGAVGQQADEGSSRYASVSDDGRTVAFESDAENLVPGDVNMTRDVFVHEFAPIAPGASFCLGDGTGAPCPCGNNGFAGRGCGHGMDHEGAELFAMGVASVTNDTLRLGARELPGPVPQGVFAQGTGTLGGGLGVPFGDGLRCLGGSVLRLHAFVSSGSQEAHYPGAGQTPISQLGQVPAASTRYYQAWYRAAALYCTPDTFNLTNAVRIDWQP